jgi:hypothetical protein
LTRFTESQGIYFTEERIELKSLGHIEIRARGQNSLLSELKSEMAASARALGGNCIMQFTYVQKADSPLKNIFSLKWDTERLVGSGEVVVLEQLPD